MILRPASTPCDARVVSTVVDKQSRLHDLIPVINKDTQDHRRAETRNKRG
jgi:hypothetical protein